MRLLALVSLKGGTGKTTLTAHLATALARRGRRPCAVDLDPQGSLGLHFGMRPGSRLGLIHVGAPRADVGRDPGRGEVPCVPFGDCTPDELAWAEAEVAADPGWLARRLDALVPAACDCIVVDTPAGRTPWLRAALALADDVLVVLLPDAASYATVPATEALLDAWWPAGGAAARYVVNQVDGRRPLCADVVAALRHALGERLLPGVVHLDERVRESLAAGVTLLDDPAGSRVLVDLEALAEAALADRPGAAEPARTSAKPEAANATRRPVPVEAKTDVE